MKIPASALILVSMLPTPQDFEIARLLGWYRIPLKSAPKVIAVDYLAFYQPLSFGEHKWCIEYYAEVKGYELVNRIELFQNEPNHPRAMEEYYKISLGSLYKIPNRIMAGKWKRITFLYTTGEYLMRAKTIQELVVNEAERHILWKALQEKAACYSITNQSAEEQNNQVQLPLDFYALSALLGIKEEWICPY